MLGARMERRGILFCDVKSREEITVLECRGNKSTGEERELMLLI